METAANISLFVVQYFPLRWTEGATAIGDDTLHIILDLAEDSTQSKVTSVRVQYLVSIFRRKGQNWGPDECVT